MRVCECAHTSVCVPVPVSQGERGGCEGMIEMFYILIRVMVTQLNKSIETHLTLHLKWILLHIGKLYLNKT